MMFLKLAPSQTLRRVAAPFSIGPATPTRFTQDWPSYCCLSSQLSRSNCGILKSYDSALVRRFTNRAAWKPSTLNTTERPFIKTSLAMSRVVVADDIQMMGTVHGGTTMEILEDAADVIANQYCNSTIPGDKESAVSSQCVIVSIDRIEFRHPLHLGDLVELYGRVVSTTKHSLNVHLDIYSESPFTGVRKHAAAASLWYAATDVDDEETVVPVPFLDGSTPVQDKLRRVQQCAIAWPKTEKDKELNTVQYAQDTTIYFIHPTNCGPRRNCRAGPMMKWMDEFGGIVAAQYFRFPAVTISADSINFLANVRLVSFLEYTARPVYSGSKSLDVQVLVDMMYFDESGLARRRTAEAFFTYVGFNPGGPAGQVPPLKLRTDEERNRFEHRKQLHDERKKNSALR